MRVPSGAYRLPSQSGETERNRRQIDVLGRRQNRRPKPPPPAVTGGPSGSTRLTAETWSVGGGIFSVNSWTGSPTPTRDSIYPADWRLPKWYYPGDSETIVSAPVPAEDGWWQVYGFAHLVFASGAPADATIRLVTYSGTSSSLGKVDTIGSDPTVDLSATSMPHWQHAGAPDDIFSGSTWVQVDGLGAAVVADATVWMDIVKLA